MSLKITVEQKSNTFGSLAPKTIFKLSDGYWYVKAGEVRGGVNAFRLDCLNPASIMDGSNIAEVAGIFGFEP